jgi:hypothetical protein
MIDKQITTVSGINLRVDETDVADSDATKSTNFDPSVRVGSITVRRGRTELENEVLDDPLRYLAKVNGFRYQISGRIVYRDMVAITAVDTLDAREIETSIVAERALSDAYIWAFIADDAVMLKDNGTVLYQWGIDLVPTPDPQICNQTGKIADDTIEAGRYTAAVTQIRFVNPDVQGPDFVGEIEGAL